MATPNQEATGNDILRKLCLQLVVSKYQTTHPHTGLRSSDCYFQSMWTICSCLDRQTSMMHFGGNLGSRFVWMIPNLSKGSLADFIVSSKLESSFNTRAVTLLGLCESFTRAIRSFKSHGTRLVAPLRFGTSLLFPHALGGSLRTNF